MSETAHIHLLSDSFELDDLDRLSTIRLDAIVGLFWMAPSTRKLLSEVSEGPCYSLSDIVENELRWGEKAVRSVDRIVLRGPSYAGLPWRTYLREPLYREALLPSLLQQLAQWCDGFRQTATASKLVVSGDLSPSDAAQFERNLQRHPGISYQILPTGRSSSRAADSSPGTKERLGRRVREASVSGSWLRHGAEALESLDKTFRLRAALGRWLTTPSVEPGGATLFSSYENNSRILSSFANELPLPSTWILTNESSQQGADSVTSSRHWIWQFAPLTDSLGDLEQATTDRPVVAGSDDTAAERWLAKSAPWRSWTEIESRMLATLTACWEHYLDVASPKLVVTANQWGIEGWITQLAQRRGIPVLQIVHGVLGGYLYTRTPVISDALIVWGDFWRQLWPPEEQKKITAYNAPQWIESVRREPLPSKQRLTYFSWPLSQLRFYSASELLDPLIDLFQQCIDGGLCSLRVRCHPLEDPGEFSARWRRRHGSVPPGVEVTKGRHLASDLAETDLAVMLRSTVLLNCLLSQIPVLMPGWIDFGWDRSLPQIPGLEIATDFSDLQATLATWLEEPPAVAGTASEPLVLPPGARRHRLREVIGRLLADSSRPAPGVPS